MRRVWASLLAAIFGFAWIDPSALGGLGDKNLPPCCRADGKHHCAMAEGKRSGSGSAFRAGRCPLFGRDQTTSPPVAAGMPRPGQAAFATVPRSSARPAQTIALGHTFFDRHAQKRGPPLSHS